MSENQITDKDVLLLTIKKRKVRFKAGSELSSPVNIAVVNTEITEAEDEESKSFEIFISIHNSTKSSKADAG
ncbi:MAG: hypothetical protein ACRCVT_14305 [Leadbetterella sp.]